MVLLLPQELVFIKLTHILLLGLQSIEKELLERLQSGTYGDIYNFPSKEYEKVLAMKEMEAVGEESDEEVMILANGDLSSTHSCSTITLAKSEISILNDFSKAATIVSPHDLLCL